jgi:hypothetical protein
MNYQPGKSQLIYMTGAMVSQTADLTGIVTRMGYFDDNNGVFFEVSDSKLKVVVRSKTSGSVVDTAVPQEDFNGSGLISTSATEMVINGVSGENETIDLTKNQIFCIDFEWLGTGRVRWGMIKNGAPVMFHAIDHANVQDVVYMSTPNLPLRYQIENTGAGAATSMRCVCQSVVSDGAAFHRNTGIVRHVSLDNDHVVCDDEDEVFVLLGFRLKADCPGATIRFINATVNILSATDNIEWDLIWNPTIAGPIVWADQSNSSLQTFKGVTANTVTNGTLVGGGYVASGKEGGSDSERMLNELILGCAIDGTRDVIVLTARPLGTGASADVVGSVEWRELA